MSNDPFDPIYGYAPGVASYPQPLMSHHTEPHMTAPSSHGYAPPASSQLFHPTPHHPHHQVAQAFSGPSGHHFSQNYTMRLVADPGVAGHQYPPPPPPPPPAYPPHLAGMSAGHGNKKRKHEDDQFSNEELWNFDNAHNFDNTGGFDGVGGFNGTDDFGNSDNFLDPDDFESDVFGDTDGLNNCNSADTGGNVDISSGPARMSDIGDRMSTKSQTIKDSHGFHLNVSIPNGPEKFCPLDRDRNHWVQPEEEHFFYQKIVPVYLATQKGKRTNVILKCLLLLWNWKPERMGPYKFPLDEAALLKARMKWGDDQMLYFLRWMGRMMRWLRSNASTVDPLIAISQKGLLATIEIWSRLLAKRRRRSKPQILYRQWPDEIQHHAASTLAKVTGSSARSIAAQRLNICLEFARKMLESKDVPCWISSREWDARKEWVDKTYDSDQAIPFRPPNNEEMTTNWYTARKQIVTIVDALATGIGGFCFMIIGTSVPGKNGKLQLISACSANGDLFDKLVTVYPQFRAQIADLLKELLPPATREQRSSVPDVSMPKKKKAKVIDDMEADYETIANPCVDIFDLDDDTAIIQPINRNTAQVPSMASGSLSQTTPASSVSPAPHQTPSAPGPSNTSQLPFDQIRQHLNQMRLTTSNHITTGEGNSLDQSQSHFTSSNNAPASFTSDPPQSWPAPNAPPQPQPSPHATQQNHGGVPWTQMRSPGPRFASPALFGDPHNQRRDGQNSLSSHSHPLRMSTSLDPSPMEGHPMPQPSLLCPLQPAEHLVSGQIQRPPTTSFEAQTRTLFNHDSAYAATPALQHIQRQVATPFELPTRHNLSHQPSYTDAPLLQSQHHFDRVHLQQAPSPLYEDSQAPTHGCLTLRASDVNTDISSTSLVPRRTDANHDQSFAQENGVMNRDTGQQETSAQPSHPIIGAASGTTVTRKNKLLPLLTLPILDERVDAKIFAAINFMQSIASAWPASGLQKAYNRAVSLLSVLIEIENKRPIAYYVSGVPGVKQPAGVTNFEKALREGSTPNLGASFSDHDWNSWWANGQCTLKVDHGGGGTLLSALAYAIWHIGRAPRSQPPGHALQAVEDWFMNNHPDLLYPFVSNDLH